VKAVILAAGQGTRLRPLTDDRPKCLVGLGGTSLLDYHLRGLRDAGISDITIIGGYRADMLPGDNATVVLNPDYAATNMVATLFCAETILSAGEDVLVSYGDCIYESRVVEAVAACDAPVALAVDVEWRRYWQQRMEDPLSDAETLRLDSFGHVMELGRKPSDYKEIEGQYMGLIKFRADYAAKLAAVWGGLAPEGPYDGKDRANMYMTSFLQYLIDIGWTVQSVPVENGWLEVDTPEDLAQYEALLASGELARFCDLP
jgi:choline kinase